LVKLDTIVKSPMGDIPTETLFQDYREDCGILSAHKWVQSAMGQQISMVLKKVEYNVKLPAGRFDLPADIQALAGKKPQ